MASRSRHSVLNILMGFINRVINIILPFILRTIIIKVLGEEYLGINNLFASVLQVFNLAELGFGSAIAANMYKPIAEKDNKTLCALLNFYRKWYRIIGCSIICMGLFLLPFVDKLINGSLPENVNIYILFLLYISQTSFSYLFWAYKSTLISAHQRMSVVESVGIFCKLITCILQVVVILVYKNITLYVLLNLVCVILHNTMCKYIADRDYPQYKCAGTLLNDIKQKIKRNIIALAFQKIGFTLSNSLGTIIVSVLLGLSSVAVYGNYYYVLSAVGAFVVMAYSSITASVGNSIVSDSVEKNYSDFFRLSFLNCWIVGWCTISLICLYQPFMKLWMGDKLMLSYFNAVLFAICFFAQYIRRVVMTYKDAAGMWYADKYKPLVGGVVNLILNIILIQYIGIGGILISAIVSNLLVEFPWETHVLFKIYFNKSEYPYYVSIAKFILSILIAGYVTFYLCELIQGSYGAFIIKVTLCIFIPNIIIYFFYRNKKEYIESKVFMTKIKNALLNK